MNQFANATGPIPAQAGIGLRAPHHEAIVREHPRITWLEAHSENYFDDGGAQTPCIERRAIGGRQHSRPAWRLVESRYPILKISQANQPGADPGLPIVRLDAGTSRVLVIRRAITSNCASSRYSS